MVTRAHAEPALPSEALPELAFATALAARLCHDLAGSLGALTGMLDMAVEGTEPEALALALTLARELSGKLRLLRAAWSDDGDVPDLASVLAGLPGAERLRIELPAGGTAMGGTAQRLAANLLLVAAGALPRGGTIRVTGGDLGLAIEIEGPRAAWPPALERCLADPAALRAASTRSREVSVAFACMVAARAGWRLAVDGPTRLTAAP